MSATKYPEKGPPAGSVDTEPSPSTYDGDVAHGTSSHINSGSQALHRNLRGKEVQLFAIGGAIGTCKSVLSHKSAAIVAARGAITSPAA